MPHINISFILAVHFLLGICPDKTSFDSDHLTLTTFYLKPIDWWKRHLTDFILSNARRFHLSNRGVIGHLRCQWVKQ